jgi:hypothetical protein
MSKTSTYVMTAERPGRRRWSSAITSPEYREFDTPKATSNPHTLDDSTPRRGMKPPEKVVDKNQPGFGESVNIPPEIFTRLVATSGEDEGGTKDKLDQIQKKQITLDPVRHHLVGLPPTPERVTVRWKKTRRNLFNHSSGAASTKHTPPGNLPLIQISSETTPSKPPSPENYTSKLTLTGDIEGVDETKEVLILKTMAIQALPPRS